MIIDQTSTDLGNRHDYDSWAENGADGWSYNEVLPYFIKSEDNQDADIAYNGYHGRGGPLTVKRSKMISPLAYAFIEAGKLFGKLLLIQLTTNANSTTIKY